MQQYFIKYAPAKNIQDFFAKSIQPEQNEIG